MTQFTYRVRVPPRYAYWTILIDAQPTAFRARDREELLPTLYQLRRTNPTVDLRWFAHGRLWDSPEQAVWARRNLPKPAAKRGRDWRPGGTHKDPRARFARKRNGRVRKGERPKSATPKSVTPPERRKVGSVRREPRKPRK
jgi:hypothetical protein